MQTFISTIAYTMSSKPETLTVKLDFETLMEFSASVRVLRGRSVSSHLHQFVINQINEAKKLVSDEEFTQLVDEQKTVSLERSRSRSLASRAKSAVGPSGMRKARIKDHDRDRG